MLELDQATALVISGTVVPMLLALVAKWKASAQFKTLVNVGLCFLAGGVVTLGDNPSGIPWQSWLVASTLSLFTSQVAYETLWKPFGIFQKIQEAVPGGFGKEVTENYVPSEEVQEMLASAGLEPSTLTVEKAQELADLSLLVSFRKGDLQVDITPVEASENI